MNRTLSASVAVVTLVAAPLATGCGGSSSPGVASIGGTGTHGSAPRRSFAAAYHCFAAHGYPNYRAPNANKTGGNGWYRRGNTIVLTPALTKMVNSPKFKAAEKACDPLFPPVKRDPAVVAARVAQARKFAECARTHGMPNMPDPESGDPPWLIDLNAAGINYDGPKFKDVLATCQSTLKNGLLPFIVGNGG
jgi:hypothetical protein